MKKEVQVPSVGESITSGIIVSWLMHNGDRAEEGDILFELETEKAVLDIPSPAAGILEILVDEGTEVAIGQTVAMLDEVQAAKTAQPIPQEPQAARQGAPPAAAPERIVSPQTPPSPTPSVVPPESPAAGERRTERVGMSAIRRKTAERLVEATQNAAYLTTFNEIDMQKVIDIRTQYKDQFQKAHGIKIGFMSFFVKACCQALKECPKINTQIDGNDIIYHYFYDIGVAVSIDEGLIVPVIRDADKRHFAEIELAIASVARRAHDRKLLPDELTGGTFTITNGGVFGSMLSTPIPAWPQTAILGMHAIKKRPVAVDDRIMIRPVMYVALTYDHRAIDGREAIGFLARIKDFIEDPDRLLLEL